MEIPKETGEVKVEKSENVWENEGNKQGIATRRISGPLSHQFSRRLIYCLILSRMTVKYVKYKQISTQQSIFFIVFYRKWYLMQNLCQWRLVASADQVFLSDHFMEDQLPTFRHQKCHKMSKYLVKNSKTTCDSLTWILNKELY